MPDKMKGYKEYWAERRAKDTSETDTCKQRVLDFIEKIKVIPIEVDRHRIRDNITTAIAGGYAEFLGVACDTCGTELVNPHRGETLLSSPPKVDARCAGCGFCGYLPAERR